MGLAKWLFAWVLSMGLVDGRVLPIYLEDSHAGSFGFFAQELDLDSEYTLILVDAHSDASGMAGSDRVRDGLRKVLSTEQRDQRIAVWRKQGVIQPYNWIEPLMPKPITKVVWVAGETLSKEQLAEMKREAGLQIDWQTQAVPRACGALKDRIEVVDWHGFQKMKIAGKIAVTIDLDYYAQDGVAESALQTHWEMLSGLAGLEALSFSVSRPWLSDDEQMWRLFSKALELSLSIRNGRVRFEPFLADVKDLSEMAKSYYVQGKVVPRMRVVDFPMEMRALLVAAGDRVMVNHQSAAWSELLETWRAELGGRSVVVRGGHQSADGVWRLAQAEDVVIEGPYLEYQKVRWWRHTPSKSVYNLRQSILAGKAFTGEASSFVGSRKVLLAETDDLALAGTRWKGFLPWKNEAGVLRLQAEIVTEDGSIWLPMIEVRVRNREGFLGALSEQFGSPYVFGVGSLRIGVETGGECLVGNDCANFLVYAWRQVGRRVPWSNPGQLRSRLKKVGEYRDGVSDVAIDDSWIKHGLVLDFGQHVAAVWQDNGVKGRLDQDDLVVHHLSGFPEIVRLEEMMKTRPGIVVGICELAGLKTPGWPRMVFGGDVNLAGMQGENILRDDQRRLVRKHDVFIVNLECGVRAGEVPMLDKGFQFIAEKEKLVLLDRAGVDVVNLANNHAMDAGVNGLQATKAALEKMGVAVLGAGVDLDAASKPTIVTVAGGTKIGFLGVNLIEAEGQSASSDHAGVLSYPRHHEEIRSRLGELETQCDLVVVLPHWGDEYTAIVNDAQRSFARWVVAQGADAVIGCHSHCVQPIEYYQGRLIAYGLGNLYFPNLGPKGFNESRLLFLDLNPATRELKYKF